MDRREALKKLGIGGATVAGASLIMSSPASADSGSPNCRYTYTAPATATISITRPQNSQVRFQLSVSSPTGSCPCGGSPTITYAFRAVLTDNGSATFGTALFGQPLPFDSGAVSLGQGNSPIAYNVQVGVRINCPEGAQPASVCRFVTVTGSAAAPINLTPTLTATSAAALPSC
jgi:hypothetical protein